MGSRLRVDPAVGPMVKSQNTITQRELACYNRMVQYHRRIDELMAMYDPQSGTPRMERERWDEARRLYTSLKSDLRDEYKRLSNSRHPRTDEESRWLQGPVHHAFVALSAATNHPPARWFSCLFDAGGDFSHMLSEMRGYFGLPSEG